MRIKNNNLTLRQLRAFEAVARLRSFVAASKEIFLTQSALSETIHQLEQAVGARLLDRTTRSVHVTVAGEDFLGEVRKIFQTLESAVRRMGELGSASQGLVRVTGATSALACLVAPCIARLAKSHPNLHFELVENGEEGIVRSVLEGEADFGVGTMPDEALRGLHALHLLTDRYGVIAQRGHEALKRRSLTISDVGAWKYIGFTTRIDNTFVRGLPSPPLSMVEPLVAVDGTVSLISLLEKGVGISILPALAVHQLITPKLEFRPFSRPVYNRQVTAVRRRGRSLSAAAQLLWEELAGAHQWLSEFDGVRFSRSQVLVKK